MRAEDYAKLLDDLEQELTVGARSVGILGLTGITLRLLESLTAIGLRAAVTAVYVSEALAGQASQLCVPVLSVKELAQERHDMLVIAADAEKEDLILSALPYVQGTPKVVV